MKRADISLYWKPTLIGLVLWASLANAFSCSSNHGTKVEGHVDCPANMSIGPTLPPAQIPSAQVPPLPTSMPGATYPLPPSPWPKGFPPPPSSWYERKVPLSPLEKAIVDACPERVWSQNVPHDECTKDGDCGDGYCDRGHCDVIRTCGHFDGLPCDADEQCAGVCFEGRCRSCVAKTECEKKDPKWPWVCNPSSATTGPRTCIVDIKMADRPGPGSP